MKKMAAPDFASVRPLGIIILIKILLVSGKCVYPAVLSDFMH